MDHVELGTACAEGLFESALSMLESGENPNQYSEDGFTPICLASFWGKADIVKSLLAFGADVNLGNIGSGMTPLHAAAFQGQGKIAHILLENGAEVGITDKYGNTAAFYASADDAIWPLFASKGCTRENENLPKINPDDIQLEEEARRRRTHFNAYTDPLREHHLAAGDVLGCHEPPVLDQPPFAMWSKP